MRVEVRVVVTCDWCGETKLETTAPVTTTKLGGDTIMTIGKPNMPEGWEMVEDQYYEGLLDYRCPECVEAIAGRAARA